MPVVQNEVSPATREAQLQVVEYLADGTGYRELAERLSKGDPKKKRRWLRKIRGWAADDLVFQQMLGSYGKTELMLGMPQITAALVRRAGKGNVPAAKLAMEASGFHNPRIQHEHSGDIKITITQAPRPAITEDVIDAEVVDED